MTTDELMQRMRELLRIHTAKLSKYEPVPDETIIEAMIAARNEALELVANGSAGTAAGLHKAITEGELSPPPNKIEEAYATGQIDAMNFLAEKIRALKVQS